MSQNFGEPGSSPNRSLKKMKITPMKIVCTLISICSYILDIGFDIYVAVRHYKSDSGTYFGLTVLFIVLPAIIMTVFSLWWYINDASSNHFKVSLTQWIIRITFLTLLMSPILRNFEALYYAMMSTKSVREARKENYVRRMVFENTDASLLRLFEAFMECAPQLILQIYIIAQAQYDKPNNISETEKIQLICILTSLVSMACAIVSYLRTLRESLDYKNELSCWITIFPLLWRFLEIFARVVTLGLFASIYLPYFFLLCGIHFSIMFVWIFIIKTNFCGNKCGEYIYNLVLSFMFIFCFINPKDDNTRLRCILYYSLIFMENSILISIWYQYCSPEMKFRLPALIMVFLSFALAIVIMVFYYILLHPTRGKISRKYSPRIRDVTVAQSIADRFILKRDVIGSRAIKEEEKFEIATQSAVEQNGKPIENIRENEQNAEFITK